MKLTRDDIEALPKRERAAFINSISGFKPANLVGTADSEGHYNLAIMSSAVHVGAHPPLLALIIRPGGDERHTLTNILDTRYYTINHVGIDFIAQAHQTAARYPQGESEFDHCGLHAHVEAGFHAPFVAEARLRMGMRLAEHHELKINGTHLVIGEVLSVELPDAALRTDYTVDLVAAGTSVLAGLESYGEVTALKRMAYAKPDLPPREID
ncbi:MAG: flavin reductase family protein [Pseudomonadota bacterium]